ncbi:uncharacterized protein V1510DRAFT_409277 [Dipodascopsis tothii]|uniref:uncharacterized protein n=1 Tax=Dipodascopsis tothii TaxID=44089 RepID=UPI0034CF2EB7
MSFSRARTRSRSSSIFSINSPLGLPVAEAAGAETWTERPAPAAAAVRPARSSSVTQYVQATAHEEDDDVVKKDPALPQELAAIIALIVAQQNRCYYEGYFVFLKDLDSDGKPVSNRVWVEVYGQLVGSVLSIWELDGALGPDGAFNPAMAPTPTYINVADASFRVMDSVPSSSPGVAPISNVLALSTTYKNRFLLQFGAREVLLLWAAALRLALFEGLALNEAYTGALLAGKGARLHGIRQILEETQFKHQEQVVVRFGTGMPWTRCWAVVTPAGYKKRKENKSGHIKFYESQRAKQKKQPPLATISAAQAVYAVYPESSVLIDQSTLLKIEGTITVDESGPRTGFIFVMPDIHPGVAGFETLIRFLIPTFDVFGLYGRPARFNADKSDRASLMFGLPDYPNTRYLDLADVYDLAPTALAENWKDSAWRAALKDVLLMKIAAGRRYDHRYLPTEPPHNTPPLDQSARFPDRDGLEKDRPSVRFA